MKAIRILLITMGVFLMGGLGSCTKESTKTSTDNEQPTNSGLPVVDTLPENLLIGVVIGREECVSDRVFGYLIDVSHPEGLGVEQHYERTYPNVVKTYSIPAQGFEVGDTVVATYRLLNEMETIRGCYMQYQMFSVPEVELTYE